MDLDLANLDLAANLGFAGKLPRQKPWRLLIGGRIRDSTVEKKIESSAEGRVGSDGQKYLVSARLVCV